MIDLDQHKPLVFWWMTEDDVLGEYYDCVGHLSNRGSRTAWLRQGCARGRAYVLYVLYPHDRSMWRCFKDPAWWAFTGIGLVPVIGPLWW